MEYRIDVVDAVTEKVVGSTMITAQEILTVQRDNAIRERGLEPFKPDVRVHASPFQPFRMQLELRTGTKLGFGSKYYTTSPKKRTQSEGKELLCCSRDGIVNKTEIDQLDFPTTD